jgi:hypothetical protein
VWPLGGNPERLKLTQSESRVRCPAIVANALKPALDVVDLSLFASAVAGTNLTSQGLPESQAQFRLNPLRYGVEAHTAARRLVASRRARPRTYKRRRRNAWVSYESPSRFCRYSP